MKSMTARDAGDELDRLVDEAANSHDPLLITGPHSKAVLIGEDDWNAIQETLFLLSIPGMRESIREGLATAPSECSEGPGW